MPGRDNGLKMYRENYILSLKNDIVDIVAKNLTPVALRYGYTSVPLETHIKWLPMVLVLGNYSSGKSTLINELLNTDVQVTGQAPTDDSFTVITHDGSPQDNSPIEVKEQRDGKFLLNDPEYPFEVLKKHGQRFASHFRLKKVNSPFLKDIAIIDTPGMLDSTSERDRGYDYQSVIGDLAQIADLVLVLFDPHKAGTGREAHISLRETLPARTFEDRVLYVLNRVDECASLPDLIRVYGTMCWNLAHITGGKDIPMIHLSYSEKAANKHLEEEEKEVLDDRKGYLRHLENQREMLKKAILETPEQHLDHLATFLETHSERLSHFLESLLRYGERYRRFSFQKNVTGFLTSILLALAFMLAMMTLPAFSGVDRVIIYSTGTALGVAFFFFWASVVAKKMKQNFHSQAAENIDMLTTLETQTRRDSWEAVKGMVSAYLKKTKGLFSPKEVKKEYLIVKRVLDEYAPEVRQDLHELSTLKEDEIPEAIEYFPEDEQQVQEIPGQKVYLYARDGRQITQIGGDDPESDE